MARAEVETRGAGRSGCGLSLSRRCFPASDSFRESIYTPARGTALPLLYVKSMPDAENTWNAHLSLSRIIIQDAPSRLHSPPTYQARRRRRASVCRRRCARSASPSPSARSSPRRPWRDARPRHYTCPSSRSQTSRTRRSACSENASSTACSGSHNCPNNLRAALGASRRTPPQGSGWCEQGDSLSGARL